MFWYLALGLVGAGALAEGASAVYKHEKAKKTAPSGGKSKTGASPVAPPGVPQPGGAVAIPVSPAVQDGDGLHNAARNLLTSLGTTGASTAKNPMVSLFQSAYNTTNPPTRLKPDGVYGVKTQAALQSVIAPAAAPSPAPGATVSTGPVRVQTPPVVAAPPIGNVDINSAASTLAALVAIPKTSDRRVSTFQAAYNMTPGVQHLAVDGKYGGATQGALQAVLDSLGTGMQAPKNPFGPMVSAPGFPPISIELS
jgi:hypothetical protein